MSSTLHDDEFGDITIKRSAKTRSITMRLTPNGQLCVNTPRHAPLFLIRHSIATHRQALRQLLRQHAAHVYQDGETIGKHHSIAIIRTQMVDQPTVRIARQKLLVSLPPEHTIDEPFSALSDKKLQPSCAAKPKPTCHSVSTSLLHALTQPTSVFASAMRALDGGAAAAQVQLALILRS